MFDHMEKITRYEKADYPGGSIYEAWNIGKIIHNIDSDLLEIKINAFNQDLYSTMNINPSAKYTISIHNVSKFMLNGLLKIEGNKLLSYRYISEKYKNNSSKKEDNYSKKEDNSTKKEDNSSKKRKII